jgi:hypothetical protein
MEESNNVYDFIEFRMHRIIEETAASGELELARQMSEALDGYLMGDIMIEFIEGWPMATKLDKK